MSGACVLAPAALCGSRFTHVSSTLVAPAGASDRAVTSAVSGCRRGGRVISHAWRLVDARWCVQPPTQSSLFILTSD